MYIAIMYIIVMLGNSSYDMPRERIFRNNVSTLSDAELLAVLLRSGGPSRAVLELARDLLIHFGNLREVLLADVRQLCEFPNIGTAKAASLKVTAEISARLHSHAPDKSTAIRTPTDLYQLMYSYLYGKDREHLYLVSLDAKKCVLSVDLLSIGSVNETIADISSVFSVLLRKSATSFALCHNHPSGDVNPSAEDIEFTHKVYATAMLVNIAFLDHLIFTDAEFLSLKSGNLLN